MGSAPATTKLQYLRLQHLHSKPHNLPPHSQNGRLRQLQLHLLELLLRSGLLHLQQISQSSYQPTFRSHHPPAPQWHSITSAFITFFFFKRETCEWIFFDNFDKCREVIVDLQEW